MADWAADVTRPPDVSVIVPTRHRPERLRSCLAALAAQHFDRERFEVVVVADGDDVLLEPTVAPFREQLRLHLVVQAHAGPARARNEGGRRASGVLLAFTDDDCQPEPGWLDALYACFQQDPEAAFGGQTVNALPDNPYSTASQWLVDYLYDYHERRLATAGTRAAPRFFTSNNFAVPAVLFHAVGGFDESFLLAGGEDRELCDRWQQRGFRLRHAPHAVIQHAHVLSLGRYWRQHMNYGRGACHLRLARAARGCPPLRREPLVFYRQLVTYPLGRSDTRRLRLVALMLLSQVANAFGFVLEACKRRVTPA